MTMAVDLGRKATKQTKNKKDARLKWVNERRTLVCARTRAFVVLQTSVYMGKRES